MRSLTFLSIAVMLSGYSFRRSPCYYNEKSNRFENENTDKELMKIELANNIKQMYCSLGNGIYQQQRNLFVYKNGKTSRVYKF